MEIYIFMFLLLYTGQLFCRHYNFRWGNLLINKNRCYLIFTWLILSFIEGLRSYNIGTDTHDYVLSFELLDFKFDTYEPLSQLIVYIVHLISDDPTMYLLICALLINGLVMVAIYRMSINCYYSVFVFVSLLFYFTSFNALRQAFAYGLILNSIYYVYRRQWVKYALLTLIAIGFHSSAIIGLIYILIPICDRSKMGEQYIDAHQRNLFSKNLWMIIVTAFFAIIFWDMIDVFLEYAAQVLPQYQVYLFNEYRNILGGIQQPVIYSMIFICFMLFVPNQARYKIFYAIPLAVTVVIACMSLKMAYLSRLMWYFDITTIISIPYMLENNIFSSSSRFILKCIFTIFCIVVLFYGLINNYMRVSDYSFIWW